MVIALLKIGGFSKQTFIRNELVNILINKEDLITDNTTASMVTFHELSLKQLKKNLKYDQALFLE
jgi:hypothetical protein